MKTSLTLARLFARVGLVAIAVAVVMVPAMARSRDRIERRDATRLSIKHSWLGVAPPTKTLVAPQPIVVLPELAVQSEQSRVAARPLLVAEFVVHPVLAQSPDPLRGPPATPLA